MKRYVKSEQGKIILEELGYVFEEKLLNGSVVYVFETNHSNRYIRKMFNVKTGGFPPGK